MTIDASLAVVIVNYGAADFIIRHLDETIASTRAFREAHVYITDNASPGDDLEKLNAHIARANLEDAVSAFAAGGNLGFAGGNNAAFARFHARPDYVFFLNPDAWPAQDAIERLVETLDANPEAAVAAPRIVNEHGETAISYFHFPAIRDQFGSEAELGFLQRRSSWRILDLDALQEPIETEWVSGASFLLRMNAAADPPMDDGYFLYFEETDMMRALAKAGWRVLLDPRSRVTHVGGLTTGASVNHLDHPLPVCWHRSWRRYFVKQYGLAGALLAALLKTGGIIAYKTKAILLGFPPRRPKRYLRDFVRYGLAPLLIGRKG